MGKLNKYGFVSGGWLFDQADRLALESIAKEFGDGYWFTACADVDYYKQVCSTKDLCFTVVDFDTDVVLDTVSVTVYASVKSLVCAEFTFHFVKKNHNYCEEGETDGRNEKR